jgi:glycosyltransferase involved in cell wall biosynthesis
VVSAVPLTDWSPDLLNIRRFSSGPASMARVRILFLSGTPTGGSARSSHALARALGERGHDVSALLRVRGHDHLDRLYKRAINLHTKLRNHPRLAAAVNIPARRLGARRHADPVDHGYLVELCVVPENGLPAVLRSAHPDVVVASSIERVGWWRVHATLRAAGVPSVLYLREANGLGHLSISKLAPDLLVANASSHAEAARVLGHDCLVIPSVVDVSGTQTTSTRQVALVVNPIPSHGLSTAWALARARPDIRFVFQESWLLSDEDAQAMRVEAAALGNVEVREFTPDPSGIYSDAKVLLVPHEIDNRPRVVAEAQANGIPVVATDFPGLREAVGTGGELVPVGAPPEQWVAALASVWDEPERYDALARAASTHAARPEMQPAAVVDRFEQALIELVGGVAEAARR